MPAQISHIIAGERALERVLGRNPGEGPPGDGPPGAAWFTLGCQGPDIFYHNQRTKPSGLHYGALAHRRRYGSLVAGAAAAVGEHQRRPDSPEGAFVLGLATHAAIDRATHPFIIFFSGMRRGCHPFLERVLDVALLDKLFGLSPREYAPAPRMALEPDPVADQRIIALWVAGLCEAYPRATASDPSLALRIANALADARHFYAVTDPAATDPAVSGHGAGGRDWIGQLPEDELSYILSIIYPEAIPEGMDPMNLAGAEWEHPSGDGRRSRTSYIDLIEEGCAEAARSMGLVMDFWRGTLTQATLALALGESGLALRDSKGESVPPLVFRPLPLPEAMEAERAARTGSR